DLARRPSRAALSGDGGESERARDQELARLRSDENVYRSILLGGLAALALTAHPVRAAEACEGTAGAGKAKLTVIAEGVRDARGEIAFTVYGDDERRFLAKGGKLARVRTAALAPR